VNSPQCAAKQTEAFKSLLHMGRLILSSQFYFDGDQVKKWVQYILREGDASHLGILVEILQRSGHP